MYFNRIKKETGDFIILTNDDENIIEYLFEIFMGLITLWIFFDIFISFVDNFSINFNNFCSIVLGALILPIAVFCLSIGFKNFITKSKVEIDLNHQKVIVKRKSYMKYLEYIEEIKISNLNKIEIRYGNSGDDCTWYIDFITNIGKLKFTLFSNNKSELKELSGRINKLINPQIILCTLRD